MQPTVWAMAIAFVLFAAPVEAAALCTFDPIKGFSCPKPKRGEGGGALLHEPKELNDVLAKQSADIEALKQQIDSMKALEN